MATAKKLPSGSWRCLVYDHTEKIWDEKKQKNVAHRVYKSFTCDDPTPAGKRECERQAAEFAVTKGNESGTSRILFKTAIERYISSRADVLSASTIREYKRSQKKDFGAINDFFIGDITQEMVQNLINNKSSTCKPKTVRNLHGLLSAVMKKYRPSFSLHTTLPQKIRPDLYIPVDDEVNTLLDMEMDDDLRIAILLAAYGPMRRSEICALKASDIKDGTAHVHNAMVLDENNEWIIKTTKSFAGDREIPLPNFVIDVIGARKGRIIHLYPSNISDRFGDLIAASGLHHFRFHDLRHYCASTLHANGMPDAYIMQRGGWESDVVLKQIYRHALSDRAKVENDKANAYFTKMNATRNATQKNRPQ
ncbi:MAG: site-specific integrase [Lachnospiraceae bacterium]|nr:site-specific integrase [Lachnospiraceae bacterium]